MVALENRSPDKMQRVIEYDDKSEVYMGVGGGLLQKSTVPSEHTAVPHAHMNSEQRNINLPAPSQIENETEFTE